jgi:serine/threonine protein kinase
MTHTGPVSTNSEHDLGNLPRPRGESNREPTESIAIEPNERAAAMVAAIEEEAVAAAERHSSMAMGTHSRSPNTHEREGNTKVAAPQARRTPAPNTPNVIVAITKDSKPPSSQPVATTAQAKPPRPPANVDSEVDGHIGTTLGSYRVVEVIGKGGMGYVFRAEHVKLGREVALKLLRSDYAQRRDAVARFFQEARTVNRVRHRNIVDVTDFVELDDGITFIIMEFLRGQSLGKWSRNKIELPRALNVLVQICDGLAAAHSVGVIHRDLKPDNIFVEPQSDGTEVAKLLDFGVAKLLNPDDDDIGFQTAAGSVIGTPAYMSPEQAGGMAVDGRADIYSLGAIMYELFTGQTMFRGKSFGEYVRKHLSEKPTLPSQTVGGANIDPRIEAIILQCVEKEPTRRFQDAKVLREQLSGVLASMESLPVADYRHPSVTPKPPLVSNPAVVQGIEDSAHQAVGTVSLSVDALKKISSLEDYIVPAKTSNVVAHYSGDMPLTRVGKKQLAWPKIVAIGTAIGAVGGLLVYAIYGGNSRPTASQVPGTQPAKANAAQLDAATLPAVMVDVRIDSRPAGSVYREGSKDAECSTPCSLAININDGGSTTSRKYLIRASHRTDTNVLIDLSPSGRREYIVTLPALEPKTPEIVDKSDSKPTVKSPDGDGRSRTRGDAASDAKAETRAAEQKAAEAKAAAEMRAVEQKAAESKAAELKAAESKAAESKAAESKAAESKAAEAKAAEAKSAEAKNPEAKTPKDTRPKDKKINPSDTINPFGN